MNIGLLLIAVGVLLLLLHASVLPAIDRTVARRHPDSRYASEIYVAWRRQHRRASLLGAVAVIALGAFFALLL